MHDASPYNHNGGPLLIDHESIRPMHYCKLEFAPLLEDLLKMPLETRGFYMTALVVMYQRMGPLPNNDDRAAMLALGIPDIRIYKRIKADLIARGHFIVSETELRNRRVEEEITAYVNEIKKRRDAALAREEKRRSNKPIEHVKLNAVAVVGDGLRPLAKPLANPLTNEHERPSYPIAKLELDHQVSKKLNKNNDDTTTVAPQLSHSSGTTIPQLTHDTRAQDSRLLEIQLESQDNQLLSVKQLPMSATDVADGLFAEASLPSLTSPPGKPVRYEYPADFEAFWRDYPDTRGMSKVEGARAWKKLSPPDRIAATASLPAWRSHLAEKRKTNPGLTTLHVQGFLNQRRFETLTPKPEAGADGQPWFRDKAKVASITEPQWRTSIARYANGTWPVVRLGPPPGHRECVVPPTIVADMRLLELYDERGIKRGGGG